MHTKSTSIHCRAHDVEQLRFEVDDLVIHADKFVLDMFSVGHFLIVFFTKSGVIRLGSGHLSVMLVDDVVCLLDFRAEGCLRVLTDSCHLFRPGLIQSLL